MYKDDNGTVHETKEAHDLANARIAVKVWVSKAGEAKDWGDRVSGDEIIADTPTLLNLLKRLVKLDPDGWKAVELGPVDVAASEAE